MPHETGFTAECEREFIAFLAPFVTEHKRRLFERILAERTRHLAVVLEDIHHSHNVSACLRSCDCFGIQDVHIVEKHNASRVNPDVALGSAGWLTLHRYADEAEPIRTCVESLRQAGYRIVLAAPPGGSTPRQQVPTPLTRYDIRAKTALVFGSELDGASELAVELADELLTIPLFGFTESLNVSVACAVCLHRLATRLRESDVAWQLSESEADEIRAGWIKHATGPRLKTFRAEFIRRGLARSARK